MPRKSLATVLTALALVLVPSAVAGPGLMVGVSDDAIKGQPDEVVTLARDLGLEAIRISVLWEPGKTELSGGEAASLDQAVSKAGGIRLVPVFYASSGDSAPTTPEAREQYCTFVRSLLARYPTINDAVIWVEPNKSFFWKPQFASDGSSAAPAAYVALLARCYDVLHQLRSGVNVIAASTSPRGNDRPSARSNISHSPGNFIRRMGEAYRALGRQTRIFDTVGHHAYGEHSAERPWKRHEGSTTISQGDWGRLMQALYDAYDGTAQPIPGEEGVTIWYLEMGYQTTIDASKASLYHGSESDPHPVASAAGSEPSAPAPADDSLAPDQGTQLLDGVRLAFCQPYVAAFFNLTLWDEPDLSRWQSGVLWADRAQKGSYGAFKSVISEVDRGGIDCSRLKGGQVEAAFEPKTEVEVENVLWPKAGSFNWRNTLWRLRVMTEEDARYVGQIVLVGRAGRTPQARGPQRTILRVRGELKAGYLAFVKFPARRLPAGRYQMKVTLTSKANASRRATIVSPAFVVKPPPGKRARR